MDDPRKGHPYSREDLHMAKKRKPEGWLVRWLDAIIKKWVENAKD